MTTEKKELLSLSVNELEELMLELGEAKYRAAQIFPLLHRGMSPDEMTNLSRALKEKLATHARWHLPTVERKLISALDGTVKYLFGLSDGNCVESVVMRYEHGNTICISSQVGCRMGCRFCASTIGGKVRDLSPAELLGQVIAAQKDTAERISNIVLMGIGEPLDNYDNVIKFLRLVNDPKGLNIGYRHISLSTCGLVDKIHRLREEDLPITLSVSLHAPDDETRSAIMPINKKYGVAELLDACRVYYAATGRRISFEYTLIAGKNDSPANAKKLARVLNDSLRNNGGVRNATKMPIHINLIPVNEVAETGFVHSGKEAVKRFAAILESCGIRATVRRTLGADINASCGQLRRESQSDKSEN
ncbi:MAG: 23S rRNA (adenine(2503)-C(2))-methyltransferase RlmN [Ruminococcaceae bacterium]|nr:23S rRNA (adenine(2503)-C(2))-methyltransferase RlmN [Oscillospiraceae bacterium]